MTITISLIIIMDRRMSVASQSEKRLDIYHYATRQGLLFALHLHVCAVPNFDCLGSVRIEETVVWWRTYFGWKSPLHNPSQLHHIWGASINPPTRDLLPVADPGTEPRSPARQRWHTAVTPLRHPGGLCSACAVRISNWLYQTELCCR